MSDKEKIDYLFELLKPDLTKFAQDLKAEAREYLEKNEGEQCKSDHSGS